MNYNYYLLNSLFQNRNRFYGAYPLRLYYNERLLKSTLFAILGFVAFIYMMRWGFHAETYAAVASSAKKDSSKVVIFIDPKDIVPDVPAQAETVKPIKGTPNTKPIITPDIKATTEVLNPKKKGALDGDAKGKNIDGPALPQIGPLVFTIVKPTKPQVYNKVDKMAEFPGLYDYLERYISYPPTAETHGKLMLSFIVELDGSLSNIRIEQSLEKPLDEEAKTAFENISKPGMWKPAILKGQQVRYKYMMPISFEEEGR